MNPLRPLRPLTLLALCLAAVPSAWAVSTQYRCDDKSVIDVDGTPRIVTVRRGQEEWRFRRTGRAPEFVDRASGGRLTLPSPFLDLQRPGLSLWCRKVPAGIPAADVYVTPRPEKPEK